MLNTLPEKALGGANLRYVVGVDEAGRGCMAGPVSVAAVCFVVSGDAAPFTVEDSKVMTALARSEAFAQICEALRPGETSHSAANTLAALDSPQSTGRVCRLQNGAEATLLGFASALIPASEIDRVNILNATLEGMASVVDQLVTALRDAGEDVNATNARILIDGPHRPWTFLPPEEHARKLKLAEKHHETPPRCQGRMYPSTTRTIPCTAVVGGDGKYLSIATASVIAKVTRDAYAEGTMERQCPRYGFAIHKGYCTPDHKKALAQHGPCVFHRREYAPVKAVMAARAAAGSGGGDVVGTKRSRAAR